MAQIVNLVPDPSFEDTIPNGQEYTQKCLYQWHNLKDSHLLAAPSAYFSLFTNFTPQKLPSSNWQYQYPRSGGGGVHLVNVFTIIQPFYVRSLVKCKLKQPLIAGKTYYAKLYCVPGERYYSRFADGISMYFDNGQLDTMISIHGDSTGIYPQVVPQVINPQGNVITDTVNWTKIEGCFVANGTESYLTIGNFKNDANTAKIVNPAGYLPDPWSGLLIDDVSVYPIDLANWLPQTYGYGGDTAIIGLPNYQTPDAKWYTYNMQLIDSGSQIKVVPAITGTKYICSIDMCNTTVFDTVTVVQWAMGIYELGIMNFELRVYPNPAHDKLIVNNEKGKIIELFDYTGKLIFTTKQNEIDVRKYARGLYFLKCEGQVVKVVLE